MKWTLQRIIANFGILWDDFYNHLHGSTPVIFTATAGQTNFDCGKSVSTKSRVFVDGYAIFTGWTASGNTVVFSIGRTVGQEIVVIPN